MFVNRFEDGHVEVTYISGHMGHELGVCELSLSAGVKDAVAMKLSLGIPADRMKALKCKPSAYIFLHVHLSLYVRTGVYGKYNLVI